MKPAPQPSLPADDGLTAESLIAALRVVGQGPCPSCAKPLCHHEALISLAMGFKAAPLCLACLAAQLGQDHLALRNQVTAYIQRRDCFRGAWEWAGEQEGFGAAPKPACVFPV